MQSFIIEGGYPLQGTITPQGAKNEALQVICACLLTEEEVRIQNIPDILDVNSALETSPGRKSVRLLDEWLRP